MDRMTRRTALLALLEEAAERADAERGMG